MMTNNKSNRILFRMKTSKYILLASVLLCFVSCFRDESTFATNPISEITIDGNSIESIYNIPKNDTLVIRPVVTQTNDELPLSYKWELNLDVVSTDTVLRHPCKSLGEFNGRLIVENEDGKAFFAFKLYVNSPYEYGITILSKDEEGRAHLSFMQEPMKEGDKKEFYAENSLEKNNLDVSFASNPSDIIQTTGSLIVACQGNNSADDKAAIYFLNEKTFVVENIVESKEYKDFKPTKLFTPGTSYDGITYPVLSEDGKMYSLPTYNAVLQPHHTLTSTYAQTGFVVDNGGGYNDIIMWDKEVNGLVLIYNSYGPYYCGEKYLLQRDSLLNDTYYKKNFSVLTGVKMLTPILRAPAQKKTEEQELIAIVEAVDKEGYGMLQKLRIATFFWEGIEGSHDKYKILDNGGIKMASYDSSIIEESTPCIANATYRTMLFANGNKVMRWYYSDSNDFLEDADELLKVGGDDAVITSFAISDDHKKTYVAFYDPTQEGKNGSVWVFDTGNGTVLETYDNVCYQPVKVIYKTK